MPNQPFINSYHFGHIEIDGKAYDSDVIVLPASVIANWWRKEGHLLHSEDLTDIFEQSPRTLVIGQGAQGCMKIASETIKALEKAGIKTIINRTDQAVKMYNDLATTGDSVAAALHLTC